MNKKITILFVFLIMCPVFSGIAESKEVIEYVNPFIGTDNSFRPSLWEANGGTYPGAALPFGMVQLTPEGYRYKDDHIKGFSFLDHTSGYPNGSSGHFRIMPFVGDYRDSEHVHSGFTHENETAQPGYYRVLLSGNNITSELTVTLHAGFCRFSFTQSKNSHIFLSDLNSAEFLDSNHIVGQTGRYYFAAEFKKSFTNTETQNNGVLVNFATKHNEVIQVKIGFSLTSVKAAQNNLSAEISDWDFDNIRTNARTAWNNELSRIKVKGGTEDQKTIFYTALYHSLLDPHLQSDVTDADAYYSYLSPWDSFRSKHPLITLLMPDRQSDFVKSVLKRYQKSGSLPTGPMTGNHNIPLIVDSYFKGITDFDQDIAWEAMRKSILEPPYARKDIASYLQYNYVPAEISYSVTKTLEYAYNDWALAGFAKKMGKEEDAQQLLERSFSYRNIFNPETKFMQAKTRSGQWVNGGFREGDKWNYTWFVPHNVNDLINLLGGKEQFIKKLGTCFEQGHYYHDNEPPLHYAYLFNYAGAPWLTQKWVSRIMETNYITAPGGLPGNDDLGALSAWYVLSAMGFYPVCPGKPVYEIGTPLFEEMRIQLVNGKELVIKATNHSIQNKFIDKVSLNGSFINRSWLTHDEIKNGGELSFSMSPQPNRLWANTTYDVSPSLTMGTPSFELTDFSLSHKEIKANEPFEIRFSVKNTGTAPGTVDIPVLVDGNIKEIQSVIVYPDEIVQVNRPFKLYAPGKRTISVHDLNAENVLVQAVDQKFVYTDYKMPSPPIVKINEPAQFSATVKNSGSYPATTETHLYVDGESIDMKKIDLGPGEERVIAFTKSFTGQGLVNIKIENLIAQKFRIYDPGNLEKKKLLVPLEFDPLLILNFDDISGGIIKDYSGYTNDGIVQGNVEQVNGLYGKAIRTNAPKGNYVEIPVNSNMQKLAKSRSLTMMAWIYPMEESNFADFLTQGDWNVLQVRASNRAVNFYSGGYQRGESYAEAPLNWNRNWHHVAGVTEKNEQKLFIDGNLVATKEIEIIGENGRANEIGEAGIPWNVGRNAQNPDRVFSGYIDEVRIYLQALSRDDIMKIMLNEE